MSKKGENIYKRKDGRWEARYIKGYQPDGKAIYGYCYAATYAGAKEKSNLMKAAVTPEIRQKRAFHASATSGLCSVKTG